MKLLISVLFILFVGINTTFAQTDSTKVEEEDYSSYETVGSVNKSYCSPKIFDLSPQRFISVAWDHQLGYNMKLSTLGDYPVDTEKPDRYETANVNSTSGIRLFANIPVVSRNNFLWQMGMNFWDMNYSISDIKSPSVDTSVIQQLKTNGLKTAGLHSTIFKPLNDKLFILMQVSGDLSGNYTFSSLQPLKYIRYSGVVIFGKRVNDRKQWGIGLSRTYRAGELNYIPVFLYNWTAPNRKWGTEVLFPARIHVRKNFNSRSLLLLGYELEGQSYRIAGNTIPSSEKALEIKRGEIRFRFEYQRQLFGFIWGSIQAGYRYNYSFNADFSSKSGADFSRYFVGTQSYAMINHIGNTFYFNIGIHLVSP